MGMQEVGIKLQMDSSSFVSSAQNIADAFSKITGKIHEAQQAGNDDLAERYEKQAMNLQHLYNGMVQGNALQQPSQQHGTGGSVVTGTISATRTGVNTVQRIATQAGRGDIVGAGISGAQGGLAILSKMGDQTAKVAGALGIPLLGAMLGNTLSNFYEQQMTSAMDINGALHNTLRTTITGDTYNQLNDTEKNGYESIGKDRNGNTLYRETAEHRTKVNSDNIKAAFDKAAEAAIKFGYSMEEGMKLVKQASAYGFTDTRLSAALYLQLNDIEKRKYTREPDGSYTSKTGNDIYKAEENILGWSRMSGVDTGTLLQYKGNRFRYGDDAADSLSAAFAVNNAMAMQRGQFAETLQALTGIMEDGLSKGFIKGTAEIGSTLSMLYKASGASKLWQGEQGAQRYMQMSNALAGSTALGSVSDILNYKAAASLSDEMKKDIRGKADIKGSYGYIDNMIALENGLSPEMIGAQRKIVQQYAGKGNDSGMIEQYRQMYGLNYTGAAKVFEMFKGNMSDAGVKEQIAQMKLDPEYLSTELKALQASESIRTEVAKIGEAVLPMKVAVESLAVNLGGVVSGDITVTDAIKNVWNKEIPTKEQKYEKGKYVLLERMQEVITKLSNSSSADLSVVHDSNTPLGKLIQELNTAFAGLKDAVSRGSEEGIRKAMEGSEILIKKAEEYY